MGDFYCHLFFSVWYPIVCLYILPSLEYNIPQVADQSFNTTNNLFHEMSIFDKKNNFVFT